MKIVNRFKKIFSKDTKEKYHFDIDQKWILLISKMIPEWKLKEIYR